MGGEAVSRTSLLPTEGAAGLGFDGFIELLQLADIKRFAGQLRKAARTREHTGQAKFLMSKSSNPASSGLVPVAMLDFFDSSFDDELELRKIRI
jgi:hypothetical protein